MEYTSGHLESGSMNIPFATALLGNGTLREEVYDEIRPWKGKPIIIIEKRPKNASKFAEALIQSKLPKVCIYCSYYGIMCVVHL